MKISQYSIIFRVSIQVAVIANAVVNASPTGTGESVKVDSAQYSMPHNNAVAMAIGIHCRPVVLQIGSDLPSLLLCDSHIAKPYMLMTR